MEIRADEKVHKILNDLAARIVDRVVEAQQTHYQASKVTNSKYTSVWNGRLKYLK